MMKIWQLGDLQIILDSGIQGSLGVIIVNMEFFWYM